MKLPFAQARELVGPPIWALGTSEPVRILLIDDDDDEAVLVRSLLARVPDVRYELDWVSNYEDGAAAIEQGRYQAFLIDQQLGGRSGIELVRAAREAGSLAALVMLTGQGQRATDVAAMTAGATDFLVKGRIDAIMLDRCLRYAITQAAAVAALERSLRHLAGLEDLGQVLLEEGPLQAMAAGVADLVVDRFGFARVAIYLAEGDVMVLAGHRGHENPVQTIERSDSAVDRVARRGRAMFVPSLRSEGTVPDGDAGAGIEVATELSVPLLVAGELVGLLNVASAVTNPIGEEDSAVIRLVADRLTASLAAVRERNLAAARLSKARKELFDPAAFLDEETSAMRRPVLEPLLDVALAAHGGTGDRGAGLLILGSEAGAGSIQALDAQASETFPSQPRVRFGETEVAVVLAATGDTTARAQAGALLSAAKDAGLDAWCGYAGSGAGTTASELIAAAQLAIAYARRSAAGTLIG